MFEISGQLKAEVKLLMQLKTADMVIFNLLLKFLNKELRNNAINKEYRSALDMAKNSVMEIVFSEQNNAANLIQFQIDMQIGRVANPFSILIAGIELFAKDDIKVFSADRTVLNLQAIRKFW